MRSLERKPGAKVAAVDDGRWYGVIHASLLEKHLWQHGCYAADGVLGVDGEGSTKIVQKDCCKVGAGEWVAGTGPTLHEMLGIELCPETVRKLVEGHGRRMARFQTEDAASEKAFQEASGDVEFTVDAAKVNTREEGWKDLKIGVISKREAGEPMAAE